MTRTAVTTETIDYPDSDGLPMAENDSQRTTMTYAIEALDAHFWEHPDVYVSGNLLMYYEEGNNKVRVAPDIFVVFGTTKHHRSSYLLWQEAKAPDFVMEVASPSTYQTDQGPKSDLYAGLGVSEYWLCDPTGAYFKPSLQGFRLVEGRYEPVPHATRSDGTLTARSAVLGLELHLNPAAPLRDVLRFHDPVRGEPLRSLREEAQAREETEARLEQTEGRLRQTEGHLRQTRDRLQESEAARQALEAELQGLRRRSGQERDNRGHER
jgi:Uma2 family endonuclease